MNTKHTIDASGKSMGRVASEAAKIILGKNTTTVKKNVVADAELLITNAGAVKVTEKAGTMKTYHSHSGYQGGNKERMLKHVIEKKGRGEAIRRAIYGMLPANRLRAIRMKRITITD